VATVLAVDDPGDPRLAAYTSLTDADLRRRLEDDEGLFVVEGKVPIRRLVTSPYPVRSLLVSPKRLHELGPELEGLDAPVFVAERSVMAAVTGFDLHRGAVAVAGRLPLLHVRDLVDSARVLVVLEGLNDHENLGAIARSARALGADALLLDPTCADPLYRRTVRVSMGEVLHLPFTRIEPWPDALDHVRAAGFTVLALTPGPGADALDEVADDPPERIALLLGAEGTGLTAAALDAADRRVRIPQRLDVDSLNVGHACAIALHRLAGHALPAQ
jgi:tRNA G18 (ribose-2'-O)-methylase SpoU